MSKTRGLILLFVTLALVLVAWSVSRQRAPETEVQKVALYPGLIDRINEVSQIEVHGQDRQTQLARAEHGWVVVNRDGFPALFTKVQEFAFGITELQIVDTKTADPARYSRLGVEDIDAEDAQSTLITLKGKDQATLASLIIGKERTSKAGASVDAHYVRRQGEQQSFLVVGNIDPASQPTAWLDKHLFDVARDRIRSLEIRQPGEPPISITRDSADATNFQLVNISAGDKLKSQITLNSMASVLDGLAFDDVASQANIELSEHPTVTIIKTFDGLVATATTADKDDRIYTRFEFGYDAALVVEQEVEPDQVTDDIAEDESAAEAVDTPANTEPGSEEPATESAEEEPQPSVEDEVKRLAALSADWVYVLPQFQLDKMTSTMEDLVVPESENEEENGAEPSE